MSGKRFILACLAMLAAGAVVADDTATPGPAATANSKIAVCAGCHGQDGSSVNPDLYPNLAGQSAAYLAIAIKSYRDGTRNNAPMKVMADTLSDQDVTELAAYFAGQPCR